MKKEEIFENRREVGKKICEHIRKNNRQMLNAKFFPERPYCDGKKNYKFSAANYLRLISTENKSIYNSDPRWITKEEIQRNGWTLKEDAASELLEVWQKSSDSEQECFLIEFYNASEIVEKETMERKSETLNNVLEFLKVRGLLEEDEEIISFQDGVEAIKKYAEENGSDELTTILTVQMFISESKLKTKIESYLPIYPKEVLSEIEENPDRIFEAASQA